MRFGVNTVGGARVVGVLLHFWNSKFQRPLSGKRAKHSRIYFTFGGIRYNGKCRPQNVDRT